MERKIEGMAPEDIKAAIKKNGLNQSAIARELKISPVVVGDVIRGIKNSRRVHEAISEATGIDLKILWPKIYLYGGGPKNPGGNRVTWNRRVS